MVHLASLKEPCMKYNPMSKELNLETVKIKQDYNDDQFWKIALQLGNNTGATFFDNFKDVLADNVEMKWDNLVIAISAADQKER
eukprot:12334154-Ditylum_brightwellii.AAC.1